MTFLKTDSKGIHELSIRAMLLNRGFFIIYGDINTENANRFLVELMTYSLEKPNEPIRILVNSPGGSIDAGMVIVDAIRSCKQDVYVYGYEKAYSMGAMILVSGTKSFLLPHSKMMIHKPWSTIKGNANDLAEHIDTLNEYENVLIEMLAEKSKHSKDDIKELMKDDRYFNAQEALEYGFIDDIADFSHLLGSEVNYASF